jgi:hypothetical protein
MNPLPVRAEDDRDAAIVAGTLCLMSCFAQHPHPSYAARIAGNLADLATSVDASAEFRTVCDRLAQRWWTLHAEAKRRCAGAPPPDRRPLQ